MKKSARNARQRITPFLWFDDQAEHIASGTLAARFYAVMNLKIELVKPYRELLAVLFAASLNPQSKIGVLGNTTTMVRYSVLNVFAKVVKDASDAPYAALTEPMAALLYTAHLLILLFWLSDRSEDGKPTIKLLLFSHDTLGLINRFLRFPPFAKSLLRLAQIVQPLLNMGL